MDFEDLHEAYLNGRMTDAEVAIAMLCNGYRAACVVLTLDAWDKEKHAMPELVHV